MVSRAAAIAAVPALGVGVARADVWAKTGQADIEYWLKGQALK